MKKGQIYKENSAEITEICLDFVKKAFKGSVFQNIQRGQKYEDFRNKFNSGK